MKKMMLISAVTIAASIHADGDMVAISYQKTDSSNNQMMTTDMMSSVSLTSARPDSENGWYLFADALYWHADIGSTDWATVSETTNGVIRTKDSVLDFKWDWGFRAGIGANIDHDMWDTNLYYTWFFADNSQKAGGGDGAVISDLLGIGSTYVPDTGRMKWDIHFSMFDWEVGRWNYFSKKLALRPFAGLKGGWIHQTIHSTFGIPANQLFLQRLDEKYKNDFWGIGPLVGVNAMWVLGSAGSMMDHRFSLLGDVSGALMYGHFNLTSRQVVTNVAGTVSDGLNLKDTSRNLAVMMARGFLGLSWDTPFNQNRCHFMLKAGYELQYWFRQNQLTATSVHPGSRVDLRRISDDLALQGVTVDLRCDF